MTIDNRPNNDVDDFSDFEDFHIGAAVVEDNYYVDSEHPQDHTAATRPIIESTYVAHNSNNDELLLQLEEQKTKNDVLTKKLEATNTNLARTEAHLENVKKLNHKLEQEIQITKIEVKNLKSTNIKFIQTIRNLQSYRGYVASLMAKKQRTTIKIQRLIQEIKKMQNIIKAKNMIIARRNHNYDMVVQQAARIIKNSYSV